MISKIIIKKDCEHLASMFVYGINFSKQVEENPKWVSAVSVATGGSSGINNGKITINLRNEISQTNNQLGSSNDWQAQQIERQVQNAIPWKRVGGCKDS